MSFIDDEIAKRDEIKRRADLISEHAPKIYLDLWGKMNAYITEAKQKGFTLRTNGSLYDGVVEYGLPSEHSTGQRPVLMVALDLTGERISAKQQGRPHFEFIFALDVCPDGVVCLKYNDEQIQTDDAAVRVLKKCLFPELSDF